MLVSLPSLPADDLSRWNTWENLIAQSHEICAPPPMLEMAARHGKTLWEGGYAEYISAGADFKPPALSHAIDQRYQAHALAVKQAVLNQTFDIIILPHWINNKPMFTFIDRSDLDGRYELVGTLRMPMTYEDLFFGAIYRRKNAPTATAGN
jgi:hypothetical protein